MKITKPLTYLNYGVFAMQDKNCILASVFIYVQAITHLDLLELHVLQSAMKQEPV